MKINSRNWKVTKAWKIQKYFDIGAVKCNSSKFFITNIRDEMIEKKYAGFQEIEKARLTFSWNNVQ